MLFLVGTGNLCFQLHMFSTNLFVSSGLQSETKLTDEWSEVARAEHNPFRPPNLFQVARVNDEEHLSFATTSRCPASKTPKESMGLGQFDLPTWTRSASVMILRWTFLVNPAHPLASTWGGSQEKKSIGYSQIPWAL